MHDLYLLQFGRPGFVGRFQSQLPLQRGDSVVVRSSRGVERAEVLVSLGSTSKEPDGEVLRIATSSDDVESCRSESLASNLLAEAELRIGNCGLPLSIVDLEMTLDNVAILHVLPWGECDATALLDELAVRFSTTVRLLDLSQSQTAKDPVTKGCGKPGCGSESGSCSTGGCSTGGCSTGSCSRGAVKSSGELTAYFADLRRKMEDSGLVRTPLN